MTRKRPKPASDRKIASIQKDFEGWRQQWKNSWPNMSKLFSTDRSLFFRLARLKLSTTAATKSPTLAQASQLARRTWEFKTKKKTKPNSEQKRPKASTAGRTVAPRARGERVTRRAAEKAVPEIAPAYDRVVTLLRKESGSRHDLVRESHLTASEVNSALAVLKDRRLIRIRQGRVQFKPHR